MKDTETQIFGGRMKTSANTDTTGIWRAKGEWLTVLQAVAGWCGAESGLFSFSTVGVGQGQTKVEGKGTRVGGGGGGGWGWPASHTCLSGSPLWSLLPVSGCRGMSGRAQPQSPAFSALA